MVVAEAVAAGYGSFSACLATAVVVAIAEAAEDLAAVAAATREAGDLVASAGAAVVEAEHLVVGSAGLILCTFAGRCRRLN